MFLQHGQVNHVAERLRHLAPARQPHAVRENSLRRLKPGGDQESRPVDSVKTQDVFADELQIGGPEFFEMLLAAELIVAEADCRDVIRQRVEPHVHSVRGIVRHGNSPFDRDAADRKVVQSAAHKAHHFVAPRFGANEVRILLVKLKQTILKLRELEEVTLLGHAIQGAFVRRAIQCPLFARRGFTFAVKLVAVGAIETLVFAFVNVAVRFRAPPQFLHAAFVIIIRRANPVVVG